MTVYGPRTELHSGHYGNWAPNPALELARLLTSMKDESGHVRIPGFYDQVVPLTALERRAIDAAPPVDAQLMRDFWLGATDEAPKPLYDLLTRPSLNIRGMASSRVGAQASNVIPSTAVATLDIRLVKGMDIARTQQLVRDYIRGQGFYVTDREPTADERLMHPKVASVVFNAATEARRTSMDLPVSQEVIRVVESARGPKRDAAHDGRGRAARSVRAAAGRHDDHRADRQSRRQPAHVQREPADPEPLGRHRADGGAADDVNQAKS